MKGVDILVALLLASEPDTRWDYALIGRALGIGSATAHRAVQRLIRAGLVWPDSRNVRRLALEEFLVHGLKYVFPTAPGPRSLGVPTAHSAPVMEGKVAAAVSDLLVWPWPEGSARGASVEPLHESAPGAALERPALHDLLALADVLRLGRPREVDAARESLRARLNDGIPA